MVYFFKDCTDEKKAEIGLKALKLASLFNYGVKVPLGFVIPKTALWKGFDEESEEDIFDAYLSLSAHEGMSTNSLLKNEEVYVAVRNSFIDEELSIGQKSILNIKGEKKLLTAIKDCYKESKEFAIKNSKKAECAIIVQKMIDAEKSGTIYPEAENLMVEAFFGLGNGLEKGDIHPDTYILDSETLVLTSFNIAQKGFEAARDIDTDETVIQELGIKSGRQVLTQKEIEEVVRQWKKTCSVLGEQKVGWSIKDNVVYVLQTKFIKDEKVEMEIFEEDKVPEMIDVEEIDAASEEYLKNDTVEIVEAKDAPLINAAQNDEFLGMAMFANQDTINNSDKKAQELPDSSLIGNPAITEEFIFQKKIDRIDHPMKNMVLANAGNIIVYTHLIIKDVLKQRLSKYQEDIPDSLLAILDMLLEFEQVESAEEIRKIDKAKNDLMNGKYPDSDDLMNAMRLV